VPIKQSPVDDDSLMHMWLQGKSPNTRQAYRVDVDQFKQHVQVPLREITAQNLGEWVDDLKRGSLRASTVSRKMATIKSLFRFAMKMGYLQHNLADMMITLPKVSDSLSERILSEEDVICMIQSPTSLRNRVILKLLYATGARVSEISQLRWMDVTPRPKYNRGQITVRGKGGGRRSIILPPSIWTDIELMKEESKFTDPMDPVFRSRHGNFISRYQIWRIVQTAAREVGVTQNVSPHWLRHAHASHALDRGAPIHLVQQTLGHKSLSTTTRYVHARPNESSSDYLDI